MRVMMTEADFENTVAETLRARGLTRIKPRFEHDGDASGFYAALSPSERVAIGVSDRTERSAIAAAAEIIARAFGRRL